MTITIIDKIYYYYYCVYRRHRNNNRLQCMVLHVIYSSSTRLICIINYERIIYIIRAVYKLNYESEFGESRVLRILKK